MVQPRVQAWQAESVSGEQALRAGDRAASGSALPAHDLTRVPLWTHAERAPGPIRERSSDGADPQLSQQARGADAACERVGETTNPAAQAPGRAHQPQHSARQAQGQEQEEEEVQRWP